MLTFELLHAVDECLYAFFGQGIVARCTESAHRAVSLDADHAALCGKLQEVCLEFLVFGCHDEADVHARAVFLHGRALEELVAVDFSVEHVRTLNGAALHFCYAALGLDPAQGLQGCVDGHDGRCVEHRASVYVCLVVQHGGYVSADAAQGVFFHDDEGHAGRCQVLLCAAIDADVFGDVDGAGEDVGRHVAYQGYVDVGVGAQFGAEDGVVGRDVEVIGIGRHGVAFGDEGVVGIGRGGDFYGFTQSFGFFQGFFGPCAGVEVGCLVLQEVVGHHAELQAGASAEEEDGVSVGDVEQFFEQGACFVYYGLEVFGTVADFHQ